MSKLVIQVGKTYKTRDGHKVEIIYRKKGVGPNDLPLVGILNNKEQTPLIYNEDGSWYLNEKCEYDLIAEDIPTRTYYRAAVYKLPDGRCYHTDDEFYDTKESFFKYMGDDAEVLEWETRELPDLGE